MGESMNIIKMTKDKQKHVHEFLGSTHLAGTTKHNHRFASVTGEAIPTGDGRHIHEYRSNTDFVAGHFHMICGKTGPDIKLKDCKHVHFEESFTTVNEGHKHEFEFITLLGPSPIED